MVGQADTLVILIISTEAVVDTLPNGGDMNTDRPPLAGSEGSEGGAGTQYPATGSYYAGGGGGGSYLSVTKQTPTANNGGVGGGGDAGGTPGPASPPSAGGAGTANTGGGGRWCCLD